jgi:hypothetical protein
MQDLELRGLTGPRHLRKIFPIRPQISEAGIMTFAIVWMAAGLRVSYEHVRIKGSKLQWLSLVILVS